MTSLPIVRVIKNARTTDIVVAAKGRTSRRRFYAAGDVTTVPYKQIVIAVGEGAKAGLSLFPRWLQLG